MKQIFALLLLVCGLAAFAAPMKPADMPAAPFVAVAPGVTAEIVLQYDPVAKTGFDWEKAKGLTWYDGTPANHIKYAVNFLTDGLRRMTGKDLPVVSRNDLSRGIVLTLLSAAPATLRKDPEIVDALRNTGEDGYNDHEAFFIRSEGKRVLLIANTAEGLANAVTELLESVDYEVLGMGPDWIYVPDYHQRPLVFSVKKAGRPSFYIRGLSGTSGQTYGVGTLFTNKLNDPTDELVDVSYNRWLIGTHMRTASMPGFPGHAMQGFHRDVVAAMRKQHITDGFLVPKCTLGMDADRPTAGPDNNGQMWIDTDAADPLDKSRVFISDGKTWAIQSLYEIGANLDLSVPLVREVVFNRMKQESESFFTQHPEDVFVYGTDPEDGGGYAALDKLLKNQNWYPDYLAGEGLKLDKPYVLNGFFGLDQPKEMWDPIFASDHVFGFDNWLLREYDKWIAAKPAAEQVTASGKKKIEQVRLSNYSYNYHDVPPNFNLDPRIRIMIASYPKHRGAGKWKNYLSHVDLAKAYQKMLPREPSGDYLILSLAALSDLGVGGIAPSWSNSAEYIHQEYGTEYHAGMKAICAEMDFNFGRMGLGYYMISKMLWNANLTTAQLDILRNRWFQRAYGSGWREMKMYYDRMQPENYPVNAPNVWARVIRYIDAAEKKIDPVREAGALRRLDDLKQFWYLHYLEDVGKATPASRELKEFAWKGQMSYITAMHAVTRMIFKTNDAAEAAGPEFNTGPAHYTHEETQAWWKLVVDHWQPTPVTLFADVTLADGKKGKEIDQNDLVLVKEFQCDIPDDRFWYNSGFQKPVKFLTTARKADDEIGFQFIWPYNPNDGYYLQKDVPYGVDYWNATKKAWEPIVDKTMTVKRSEEVEFNKTKYQLVAVRLKAAKPGTYRFDVGYGGNVSPFSSLDYDQKTGKYLGDIRGGFTYFLNAEGWTQSPVYLYLPKGLKSLDLETWDTYGAKTLTLFNTLPAKGLKAARTVDISKMGTHTVELKPGEDGTVAMISGNGFAFPYMYSVPSLWAKTPRVLLVPRGIAKADGLTPIEDN